MKHWNTIKKMLLIIPRVLWIVGSCMFGADLLTGDNNIIHYTTQTWDINESITINKYNKTYHEERDINILYNQYLPTVDDALYSDTTIIIEEKIVASTAWIYSIKNNNCYNAQHTLSHMATSNTTQTAIIKQKRKRLEQIWCTE